MLGYPYGPVFLALLISIFGAVRTGHRIARSGSGWPPDTWCSSGLADLADDRVATRCASPVVLTSIQVAVWFVLALVVAEAIRVRARTSPRCAGR